MLLLSLTQALGVSSSSAQAAGIFSSTGLGMLKREIPRELGVSYIGHSLGFPGRGLQSAGLSLHCLHVPR